MTVVRGEPSRGIEFLRACTYQGVRCEQGTRIVFAAIDSVGVAGDCPGRRLAQGERQGQQIFAIAAAPTVLGLQGNGGFTARDEGERLSAC